MAEDVRKVGVEVAFDANLGEGYFWAVGVLEDLANGFAAAEDDIFGDTLEKNFADEFGLGELRTGGEPGSVECVGKGEVLLGDYAAGDALGVECKREGGSGIEKGKGEGGVTNSTEDGVHELVQLCRGHETIAFENAHSQLGNHRQMGFEHGSYRLAKAVIVLERLDVLHFPKCVEGIVIQIVHLVYVWVRDDDVGQLLHVADPVSDPGWESLVSRTSCIVVEEGHLPRWQLCPHIVGRADQPRLGQGAAKHHKLAQADGAGFLCDPSDTMRSEHDNDTELSRVGGGRRGSYSSKTETGRHFGL